MKKQIIAIVLALVLVMCLGVTAAFADGDTYSVTVNVEPDGGGQVATNPNPATGLNTGAEVTLTASPTEGYQFKEWKVISGDVTVPNENPAKFNIGTSDVKVQAVFEEEAAPAATYTVTAAEATNGMVRVDKPEAAEGDKVKITAEANDGYVIDEITYSYTTAEATEPTVETVSKDKKNSFTGNITMPAADVTVAATFREGYPITTRVDKAGTGTVEVEPQSGVKGDKITVKVKPADGYELEKVVYIVSGNSKENKITIKSNKGTFDMPDNKAVTVKAYFTAIDYTVTVDDAIENGKATVSKKTANVGDTITVKATPDYGYAVAKITYKEDGSSKKIDITEDEEFEMPAADVTVYVTFKEVDATVIIKDADHGTAQADPLDAEKGDKATITVKPDTGYSVSSVTVKDSRGKDVEVEKDKKNANKYTFTMPSGKATVTVSFFESACPSAAYKDVDTTQWYHEGVDYAVVKGLMFGTAEDTFSPNGTLSRAMLVTILYRMEGEPTVQGSSPFSDVLDRQWYTYAVMWANNNKIVEGYSSDTFGPNDNVTREQMAAIFYRYAKYKGADMSKTANIASYKDAADVSSWAVASMRWAVGVGLITGRANSMLAPQGDTSRAEAATMFMRLDKEVL